jgi:hypothetical protein
MDAIKTVKIEHNPEYKMRYKEQMRFSSNISEIECE